ncbi:MAG: YebC/PmpR family DNA-binding transcriptional regulator [Phycisphaerae bacterium]|nr:YebC/PmpR family DNA-binding transcriptional regulator [Phycisphaerae bacterium]
MAKHNKWSKVKHRKAVVDKKRGRIWTKCVRAIMVAARAGGGDPSSNASLRIAVDEARYANVPKDTIERAIRKATGELGAESYEPVRYECYGPGGVAIIADALTDNRTRTITDVRLAFSKFGGNVGATGCVAFTFEPRGEVLVTAGPPVPRGRETVPGPVDPDAILELALEAGAGNLEAPDPDDPDDTSWLVSTDVASFTRVKDAIEDAGYTVGQARLVMAPTGRQTVRGEDARNLLLLIDALEDLDDIQKVYTNADIPDEELARLQG